jgi:hypothetical protein
LAIQSGCAGQAGAVTRLPSTWALSRAMSAYLPPAQTTSGAAGGIGRAAFALEHSGRDQNQRTMADGGDGLARGVELAHDLKDPGVQADVFRSPPAGHDQPDIVGRVHRGEILVQGEIVPRFSL